jgi:hypothetical protein
MLTIITVTPAYELDEDHPDSSITGTYLVELRDDVPQQLIADASLEGFHQSFGIEERDDFVVTVHDHDTGAMLAEPEHSSGDVGKYCVDVEFLSDDIDAKYLIAA